MQLKETIVVKPLVKRSITIISNQFGSIMHFRNCKPADLDLHCFQKVTWDFENKSSAQSCADPEGGRGSDLLPSPEYHKATGLLSNTGPDPLRNHKAATCKPAFNARPSSARQRNAI